MQQNSKLSENGFTLLELLVASALSLLLLTIGSLVLLNSFEVFSRMSNQASFQSQSRHIFKGFKNDVKNSVMITFPIINATSNTLRVSGSKRFRVLMEKQDSSNNYRKPGYQTPWDETEEVNVYRLTEDPDGTKNYQLLENGYSVDTANGTITLDEQTDTPIAADFTEKVTIEYSLGNGNLVRTVKRPDGTFVKNETISEKVINGRDSGDADERLPVFSRSTVTVQMDLVFATGTDAGSKRYKAQTFASVLGTGSIFDLERFNPTSIYSSRNVRGLAFTSTNRVYFGTDFLALQYRYSNGSWVANGTSYPAFNVYDIHFAGLSGLMVGTSGRIRKYVASSLNEMYLWEDDYAYSENNSGQTSRTLNGCWLESDSTRFAVGEPVSYQIPIYEEVQDPYYGWSYWNIVGYETKYFSAIKRTSTWSGYSWSKIGASSTSSTNRTLYAVTGRGNTQFAVGDSGLVLYGNDLANELRLISGGFRPRLKTCWLVPKYENPSQYYVWAAGERGYMFRYDSATSSWEDMTEFNTEPPGTNGHKRTINSMCLLDSRYGYACGDDGLILKYESGNWLPLSYPKLTETETPVRLNKVRLYAGSKNLKGFIVGENSVGIWIKK